MRPVRINEAVRAKVTSGCSFTRTKLGHRLGIVHQTSEPPLSPHPLSPAPPGSAPAALSGSGPAAAYGSGPEQAAGLGFHGDAEVAPGLVDLAVNVRHEPLPDWLREPIAGRARPTWPRYPDPGPARAALSPPGTAVTPAEVLLTAGAAEAFVLLARALRGVRRPVVVHPQFTEPEAALRAAGHRVRAGAARDRRTGWIRCSGPGRRRPGGDRQPDQPDLGAAPGAACWPRWPGRAGYSWSTRRSPTPCPASRSRWPAGPTCPGWWSCAA